MVERAAVGAVAVGAVLDLRLGAQQVRLDERAVDDARGAAEAEEHRIGAAADLDAVDVVAIDGHARAEEVASVVRRAEAAHARAGRHVLKRAVVVHLRSAREGAGHGLGKISAHAADLGAQRVGEQILEVARPDVVHEIPRHDRHGRRDVAQLRAQSCARLRARRKIALILRLAHFKGRQHDGGLTRGAGITWGDRVGLRAVAWRRRLRRPWAVWVGVLAPHRQCTGHAILRRDEARARQHLIECLARGELAAHRIGADRPRDVARIEHLDARLLREALDRPLGRVGGQVVVFLRRPGAENRGKGEARRERPHCEGT